jgi:predicted deacetylase
MKNLVIALHDVSPLTQRLCEEILSQLRELGVRQTSLLVIPNHHGRAPIAENPAFKNWLIQNVEAGHEPVLHGYFHQRPRAKSDSFWKQLTTELYTAGEGEFFDLSTAAAAMLLEKGLADLSFLSRRIAGFVAPAWLLGSSAETAVRNLDFSYTTRLNSVRQFASGTDLRSQSLVWSTRATWRVAMSLIWNRSLAYGLGGAPLVRLGIHPPDLEHARVWNQIRDLVAVATRTRECVSYEKFIEKLGQLSHR